MAVTVRTRKTALAIVATLVFYFAAGFWMMAVATEKASAQGAPEQRIMIAWEDGRAGLERLLSASAHDAGLKKQLDGIPGLCESLRDSTWPAPYLQSIELRRGASLEGAKKTLSVLPGVRYVEADERVKVEAAAYDPYFGNQWFLPRVGAARAWDAGIDGSGVLVAVVDSGVDASHPDLAGRVESGYDFVEGDDDTSDAYGHGTHVAGIVAAAGDNGVGVAGMAWRARILPVRVLDGEGGGYYSDIIAGIRYAAERGARVINLSLGGGADSQALQEAVDYARCKGCILVAAAGNGGLDTLSYPAAYEGVLAVGATDGDDRPASFSNRGKSLDLVAPGISIYSTYPGGRYTAMSGTSMAAPQVSGALALLLSARPDLSTQEAEARLTGSACDLCDRGRDAFSGWGLLKVDRALDLDVKQNDGDNGELYFAEGYTGPGFDTYLLLENPSTEDTRASLELFGNGGPLCASQVSVPPRARSTLHVNRLVPPGDVSIKLSPEPGSQLRAQRSMYFDYHGIGDGHTAGASGVSREWCFAEGYTGEGFDTYLLVFNPQSATARITLELMTPEGCAEHCVQVPPMSRSTLRLNDVLPGAEVAARLVSDLPVVAERAMYFELPGKEGGSVVMGAHAATEDWYFAEGYTGEGFDTWILLANPSTSPVTAKAFFQRKDGIVLERDTVLEPRTRATIHLDEIPGLESAEVSTRVKTDYPGVVAERAMYFSHTGPMGMVGGGHAAVGTNEPSSRWLIPEGYTGSGFESWILIANMEKDTARVRVELMGESGKVVTVERDIAPYARLSLRENDFLAGEGVSAEVSAPGGELLVVEGAFYFRYRDGIDGGSS